MAELGLSARAFAKALDVPVNRVTQILNERRGVTADTALRLGRYFGTSAEFWVDLQGDYELRRVREQAGEVIARAVAPRRRRPLGPTPAHRGRATEGGSADGDEG